VRTKRKVVESPDRDQPVALDRFSDIDEQARAEALRAEARSGLIRAGRPPPAFDRDMIRALVDAGYMSVADYIAVYDAEAGQEPPKPDWSLSVSARFSIAVPRRNVYRPTSVRCSLAKAPSRPARRRA
jgi:hypothetical protein